MTRNNKFEHESQDARRHDKQRATHPDEKLSHLTNNKKNPKKKK